MLTYLPSTLHVHLNRTRPMPTRTLVPPNSSKQVRLGLFTRAAYNEPQVGNILPLMKTFASRQALLRDLDRTTGYESPGCGFRCRFGDDKKLRRDQR